MGGGGGVRTMYSKIWLFPDKTLLIKIFSLIDKFCDKCVAEQYLSTLPMGSSISFASDIKQI